MYTESAGEVNNVHSSQQVQDGECKQSWGSYVLLTYRGAHNPWGNTVVLPTPVTANDATIEQFFPVWQGLTKNDMLHMRH